MEKEGARARDKKAQIMGMPFQFIFALILIAVAIFVGFFVIRHFLRVAELANINNFVKIQLERESVQAIWIGPEAASVTKSLAFSKNFDYVCFYNQSKSCNSVIEGFCAQYELWKSRADNKENLFLVPLGKAEDYGAKTAWFIQCGSETAPKDCISFTANPLCLPVENGKVNIKLTKESGQRFVTISRP